MDPQSGSELLKRKAPPRARPRPVLHRRGARPGRGAAIRRLFPAHEWPTWAAILGCYGGWALAVWSYPALGPLGFAVIGGYLIALNSSLQHEAVHGHPTRSRALNEAAVFWTLNLVVPYRRFLSIHLKHHHDERLTDPYDDPESHYLAEGDWRRTPPLMRALLRINGTLAGRLLLGPWLGTYALWRGDLKTAMRGGREGRAVVDAHLRNALSAAAVLWFVSAVGGMSVWEYVLFGVWPGYALLMLRTYAEHRAAEAPGARTAIVEAEPIFGFLFLNNNLHAVHHARPTEPWFRLPAIWRAERDQVLAQNGGYHIQGYRELARRWLFTRREPIAHPFMRRTPK